MLGSSPPCPISSPESFCARLKKRKTLGRSVEERILIGFYENNTNDRKSFRTKQNGAESSPKVSACVQVLQLLRRIILYIYMESKPQMNHFWIFSRNSWVISETEPMDCLPKHVDCYDKIKFREILEKSTVNQRSLLRFKRRKSEGDTPSGKSPATRHQRKKKATDNYSTFNYSDQMAPTSWSRVQLFRPIAGFHMTSLNFKLQNYWSSWNVTFMMNKSC